MKGIITWLSLAIQKMKGIITWLSLPILKMKGIITWLSLPILKMKGIITYSYLWLSLAMLDYPLCWNVFVVFVNI